MYAAMLAVGVVLGVFALAITLAWFTDPLFELLERLDYLSRRKQVWCVCENNGYVGFVPRHVLDRLSRQFWRWQYKHGGYAVNEFNAVRIRPNQNDVILLRANHCHLPKLVKNLKVEQREFTLPHPSRALEYVEFGQAFKRIHGYDFQTNDEYIL